MKMRTTARDEALECPLPNSSEAERAILGAILLDNALVNQAIELLKAEDFYVPSHRRIFLAMIALSERGSEINPILISEELRRAGDLEATGGLTFITGVTYGLPHFTNVAAYAKIVRDKSLLRNIAKVSSKIETAALCEEDSTQVIADALSSFEYLKQCAEGKDNSALHIISMSSVETEIVRWLWLPYIALGKLTILEGDPGLGKSWLTCALAAAVSCGRGLPGMDSFEPGNVLMLSAEDGLADTLRPRLDAVSADVSRVFALAEPLTFDTAGLIRLESTIIERKPRLVIIDPLFAFTGGKVDIHRANECRAISAPLAAIAERRGCALLAVRHLGKSRGSGHALNAGIGSIDFAAAARSVLLVGADPDDPHKRGVVQTKNNLAPHGGAIGYTLEDGQFYWTGASTLTAGCILSLPSNEEGRSARSEAEDFLRDCLAAGACASKEIKSEAKRAGISEITLRRAKDKLGIRAIKDGLGGWVWELREGDHSQVEDAQKTEDEHLQPNDTNKATYSNNLTEDAHVSAFEQLQGKDEQLQRWDYPPDLDPSEFDARCVEVAESHDTSLREAAHIVIREHKAASATRETMR